MNILLAMLLVVQSSTDAGKPDVATHGFRGIAWGSSVADLKSRESGPPNHVAADIVIFPGTLAGLDVSVGYQFADGGLARGTYVDREPHADYNDYLTDYYKLGYLLAQKYGKPHKSGIKWTDYRFTNNRSYYGLAVALGHVTFSEEWHLSDTDIVLTARGSNGVIGVQIVYTNPGLWNQKLGTETERALEDL